MGMIITVDGPSGAGKGTLCYALAEKLGFTLLDSGAIYRVTALAALKRHADLTDEEGLAELARHLDIQFIPKNGEVNVLLGGMDVSHFIRTQEVAEAASKVAVFPKVRAALLQLQQDFGKNDGLIADGRDMGTVVFPNVTAVEMEATAIAQVCHAFNVPFVVVRAISDAGDGEASMSFEEFLPLAAKQSSALVLGMIDRL